MGTFFNAVITFFENIGAIISNFFTSIIKLFDISQVAVAMPLALQGILPDIIGTCIVAVISLGVIKFIFGR